MTTTATIVQNVLGETFDLSTMTGWQVKKLCRELTAESVMYGNSNDVAKRDWLRHQRDIVDAEIRRKCY